MFPAGRTRLIPGLALAALVVAIAGCGSDSSGSDSTAAQVSIPSPTSPLSTTAPTAAATTTSAKKNKPAPTTGGVSPGSCEIPDAYGDFKYTGIDCAGAVAIATAWDQDGKDCNTVDNPDSPDGYNRTCTVQGYTCTAKRDVKSDARFVSCTQGGQSIRFTWLPA